MKLENKTIFEIFAGLQSHLSDLALTLPKDYRGKFLQKYSQFYNCKYYFTFVNYICKIQNKYTIINNDAFVRQMMDDEILPLPYFFVERDGEILPLPSFYTEIDYDKFYTAFYNIFFVFVHKIRNCIFGIRGRNLEYDEITDDTQLPFVMKMRYLYASMVENCNFKNLKEKNIDEIISTFDEIYEQRTFRNFQLFYDECISQMYNILGFEITNVNNDEKKSKNLYLVIFIYFYENLCRFFYKTKKYKAGEKNDVEENVLSEY